MNFICSSKNVRVRMRFKLDAHHHIIVSVSFAPSLNLTIQFVNNVSIINACVIEERAAGAQRRLPNKDICNHELLVICVYGITRLVFADKRKGGSVGGERG